VVLGRSNGWLLFGHLCTFGSYNTRELSNVQLLAVLLHIWFKSWPGTQYPIFCGLPQSFQEILRSIPFHIIYKSLFIIILPFLMWYYIIYAADTASSHKQRNNQTRNFLQWLNNYRLYGKDPAPKKAYE
jgi:hypothetical protein